MNPVLGVSAILYRLARGYGGCQDKRTAFVAPAVQPQCRWALLAALCALPVKASATGYAVIHSFGPTNDGRNPAAELLAVGDTLYGTTYNGGTGWGAVFSITTDGTEKLVYAFKGNADGEFPVGKLLYSGGKLYGMTFAGGNEDDCAGGGCGLIYSLTLSGTKTTLHVFTGYPSDAAQPYTGGLIAVGSVFYGTTYSGGSNDGGAIFTITPSGNYQVIAGTFPQSLGRPTTGLLNIKNTLYGAATGALYRTSLTGTISPVLSLTSTEGTVPYGGVLDALGTLYATTGNGGANYGGTIFKTTKSGGAPTVLQAFGTATTNGSNPYGDLVYTGGEIYGVTRFGGGSPGHGVVYKVTPGGGFALVHAFTNANGDGAQPQAGLTLLKGVLYGTTSYGGPYNYGTVFRVTP